MFRSRCFSGLSKGARTARPDTGIRVRRQCIRAQKFSATTLPNAGPLTKVEKIIHDTIKATGPISFAKYMQMCLSHPTEGYYMNPSHSVFGSRGDFITSPEISQTFGELVAIWLLSQWMHFGQGKKIRMVELGPGRGTLMSDMLRVFSQFPAGRAAVEEVGLIETSESMQALQKEKLSHLTSTNNWNVNWFSALDDFPADKDKFTIIVAHEFFDALPFHLLQKCDDGWREVLIASGPDPAAPSVLKASHLVGAPASPNAAPHGDSGVLDSSSRFRRILSSAPSPVSNLLGASSSRFEKLPVGTRIEVSPSAFKIARRVGELLQSDPLIPHNVPGCALIVDYGGDKFFGSSFRAFKDHKIVDVFHRPGECDLTVNVDFAYLKDAIADLAVTHGPIPQGTFLQRMGIQLRTEGLKKAAQTEGRKRDIHTAAKRLVDPLGMGSQYQFMAVTGTKHLQPPPSQEQKWPFVED